MIRKDGGWLRNQIKKALKYGDIYIHAEWLVKENMKEYYDATLSLLKHFDTDWCLLKPGLVYCSIYKKTRKGVIA